MPRRRRSSPFRSLVALAVAATSLVVTAQPAPAITAFAGLFVYRPGPAGDALWHTGITTPKTVSGNYVPIVGNFKGDFTDDIFWYGPGTLPDTLWEINSDGTHTAHPMTVNGSDFIPVTGWFSETVDAGGDNYDDILWYRPGPGAESYWDFENGGGITKTGGAWINGTYKPVVGRFMEKEGPGADFSDDILWFKGGGQSTLWDYNRDTTISKTAWDLGADGTPLVIQIEARDRLFVYRPGSATETMVNFFDEEFTSHSVSGTYVPVIGRMGGPSDFSESILWYKAGTGADPTWHWNGSTFVAGPTRSINGTYTPVIDRFANAGSGTAIIWYSAAGGNSPVWIFDGSDYTTTSLTLPPSGKPIPLFGFTVAGP